jgi:hypothetical protein
VKDILHIYLDSASFRTVWKCLKYSPLFLGRGFNRYAICASLRVTGIIHHDGKFSSDVILQQCPFWNTLSQDKKDCLISRLPVFHQIFNENGYLPEVEFDRIFADNSDVDNSPKRKGMPLNLLGSNRQRCSVVGNRQ